jgi:hypothetical protein
MRFVQQGRFQQEHGLIISPDRPKHLMIKAASIGFDLREACSSGSVKLMRSPPVLAQKDISDERVARALDDLSSIIRHHRPDRLVVDDFMPFVQFHTFERFRDAFTRFLDQIDPCDTTMNLVMAEPANPQSQKVVDFMCGQMTGAIHIEYPPGDGESTQRRLTLIPTIGHLTGRVVKPWDVTEILIQDPNLGDDRRSMLPEMERSSKQAHRMPQDMPSKSKQRALRRQSPIRAIPLGRRSAEQSKVVQNEAARHITTSLPAETYYSSRRWKPGRDAPPSDYEWKHHTELESFKTRLEEHFLRRQEGESAFVLIAMRMDRTPESAVQSFDFEFIVQLSGDLIGATDALLVDLHLERLILLFEDSPEDKAQEFFVALKDRLESEAPHMADHLLHSASAIVVPNGRPFRDADEFLSYALTES